MAEALMDILGEDIVAEWFKQAHEIDPDVKLYINDYGILRVVTEHQMHYENFISNLIKNGAPLYGIGMQGHSGAKLVHPEKILEVLDRFSKFNLPLKVTEFDLEFHEHISNREEIYADYMRDFMTIVLSHPSVESILIWGFWDGAHWIPGAGLYHKNWEAKPSAKMWKYLVSEKWHTVVSGKTDKRGEFALRGFHGDYDIEVEAKGKSRSVKAKLIKVGSKVTVTMD